MIRHIVLLRFVEGLDHAHLERVLAALAELPARIPAIRSFVIGQDLGLAEGNAHITVAADFDDVVGYESYRDDPEHVRIIVDLIRPHLEQRSAIQFEL